MQDEEKKMSAVENVIEKQIDLMKQDLDIVLQKTKIKEYEARANVLNARVEVEKYKLQGMQNARQKQEA